MCHIYADDDLMADTRERMRMTLAAAVEALFAVMGIPMTHRRQCGVALDKWNALLVSYYLIILGLVFNTRNMTVGVIPTYRRGVIHLLDSHWVDIEAFHIKYQRDGGISRKTWQDWPCLSPHLPSYAIHVCLGFLASTSRRFVR